MAAPYPFNSSGVCCLDGLLARSGLTLVLLIGGVPNESCDENADDDDVAYGSGGRLAIDFSSGTDNATPLAVLWQLVVLTTHPLARILDLQRARD